MAALSPDETATLTQHPLFLPMRLLCMTLADALGIQQNIDHDLVRQQLKGMQQAVPFSWIKRAPQNEYTGDFMLLEFAHVPNVRCNGKLYLIIMQHGCAAPYHRHGEEGLPFGEFVYSAGGILIDQTDDGQAVVLDKPGDYVFHGGGTEHAPRTPSSWIGFAYQPGGSTIIRPPAH